MAGAFTHFVICDVAKRDETAIGNNLWRLLNRYSEFLYLGAASPDLPYLSFRTGETNWADVMHYEKTNSIVVSGHEELRGGWSSKTPLEDIKLVWLLGYTSHLVTDATIHPIVQAIVGTYELNKEEHRICEMTQDSLIFNSIKNNDIFYAEFSSALKFCKRSEYFDGLMQFWKKHTSLNYQDKGEEPNPELWFTTYTNAIDAAEGGSKVVGFFRHLGVGTNYIYRPKTEIETSFSEGLRKYYEQVKLPNGNFGSFAKDGFENALRNVLNVWNMLYSGLTTAPVEVSNVVKNWNLDKGEDMDSPNNDVTYWV